MAFLASKHLINNITRSSIIPTARANITAARILGSRSFNTNANTNTNSINCNSNSADHLSIVPHYDLFGRFFPTRKLSWLYKRRICLPSAKWVKPWLSAETNDNLYYYIYVNGVGYGHVKVSVHHKTVLIEAQGNDQFKTQRGFEKYVCWIDLPDIDSPNKRYKISDIKAERKINDGEVKLIIPKFKREEKVFKVNINPIPQDEN